MNEHTLTKARELLFALNTLYGGAGTFTQAQLDDYAEVLVARALVEYAEATKT